MSTQSLRPWAAALAFLALAAVARAAPADEVRQVTVVGRGEVRAAPDRATVTLGVHATAPTVEAARGEADRVVASLLAVARGLKLADADVRATGLSVSPDYDFGDGRRTRKLLGYSVDRQVVVLLKDIDRLGELIERGLGAGANTASSPQLDSSRRAELEREALARAVGDARQNAAAIATALEATVGRVRAVRQNGAQMPGTEEVVVTAARYAGAPPAQSYQPGEIVFDATVSASFDLVPAGH
ncbi:MAG TPA: SIMPL domain-containing protein [Steroidobacteraceae bacterium]|nr:SIMPL domain-containing protein [Steroidobacteraceae bacterium]